MARRGLIWVMLLAALWAGAGGGEAAVKLQTLAANLTANATAPAQRTEIAYSDNPAPKSIYGQVVCSSGPCTQTQAIYGDIDNDSANGILLCTLTLSGTPRAQDACPVITASYAWFYVVTTGTSGTSARGDVYAMY